MSLFRADHRLARAKRRREDPDEDEDEEANAAERVAGRVVNLRSEIGDERPIAACAFAPLGDQLAAGAWNGAVKLWSVPDCRRLASFVATDTRITGALIP